MRWCRAVGWREVEIKWSQMSSWKQCLNKKGIRGGPKLCCVCIEANFLTGGKWWEWPHSLRSSGCEGWWLSGCHCCSGSVGINGTGNPVHLPNPNSPACVLTNLNFWCRVFQLTCCTIDFTSLWMSHERVSTCVYLYKYGYVLVLVCWAVTLHALMLHAHAHLKWV